MLTWLLISKIRYYYIAHIELPTATHEMCSTAPANEKLIGKACYKKKRAMGKIRPLKSCNYHFRFNRSPVGLSHWILYKPGPAQLPHFYACLYSFILSRSHPLFSQLWTWLPWLTPQKPHHSPNFISQPLGLQIIFHYKLLLLLWESIINTSNPGFLTFLRF